jgi:hypothetical protein
MLTINFDVVFVCLFPFSASLEVYLLCSLYVIQNQDTQLELGKTSTASLGDSKMNGTRMGFWFEWPPSRYMHIAYTRRTNSALLGNG